MHFIYFSLNVNHLSILISAATNHADIADWVVVFHLEGS